MEGFEPEAGVEVPWPPPTTGVGDEEAAAAAGSAWEVSFDCGGGSGGSGGCNATGNITYRHTGRFAGDWHGFDLSAMVLK